MHTPHMAESVNTPDLTEQQLRFAHEYAADPNATQAYMRAFGAVAYNTAKTEGCKLLTNPNVQLEVAAARKEHQRKCRVSAVRTLQGLSAIAHLDPSDLFDADPNNGNLPTPKPWNKVPAAARRAVQGIKIKRRKLKSESGELYEVEEIEYKLCDKMQAFDKLCKHLGITKDDVAETVADAVKILRLSDAAAKVLEAGPTEAPTPTPLVVDESKPA